MKDEVKNQYGLIVATIIFNLLGCIVFIGLISKSELMKELKTKNKESILSQHILGLIVIGIIIICYLIFFISSVIFITKNTYNKKEGDFCIFILLFSLINLGITYFTCKKKKKLDYDDFA